jgi:hypothetical protein
MMVMIELRILYLEAAQFMLFLARLPNDETFRRPGQRIFHRGYSLLFPVVSLDTPGGAAEAPA